jgi:hypothetical protein
MNEKLGSCDKTKGLGLGSKLWEVPRKYKEGTVGNKDWTPKCTYAGPLLSLEHEKGAILSLEEAANGCLSGFSLYTKQARNQ